MNRNLKRASVLFALYAAILALSAAYAAEFNVVDKLTVTGNTGMGITNPSYRLHVANGTIYIDATQPYSLIALGRLGIGLTNPASWLGVAGNATIGSGWAASYGAPTNSLIVQGNIGIGLTNPVNALDVSGNAKVTGSMTVGSISVAGGGTQLYVVGNSWCQETPGTVTNSSSCYTRRCTSSVSFRNNTFYNCSGGCTTGYPQTCGNNAIAGKLLGY